MNIDEIARVQCPFCGHVFELEVDTTDHRQSFTTDCEGCCRPFTVSLECEPGEISRLDTDTE